MVHGDLVEREGNVAFGLERDGFLEFLQGHFRELDVAGDGETVAHRRHDEAAADARVLKEQVAFGSKALNIDDLIVLDQAGGGRAYGEGLEVRRRAAPQLDDL